MKDTAREISPRIARQRERVHDLVLNSLANSVKDLRPKMILDVGTGYGTNLRFLARRFGNRSRIWSVDASPGVVREMKKILRDHRYSRHVTVKRADAQRLPFKNAHFDLVVSLFSLHHLTDPKRGLSEMTRTLSPGGKLIIADWTRTAGRQLKLHEPNEIPSPTSVIKELKRQGLRARSRIRPYWYSVEAVK
jgi:ubiquinone/menaquinone biosynthesis C-methylase UbiE